MSLLSFGTRLQATVRDAVKFGKAGYQIETVDERGEVRIISGAGFHAQGEIVTLVLRPGALLADGYWQIATD